MCWISGTGSFPKPNRFPLGIDLFQGRAFLRGPSGGGEMFAPESQGFNDFRERTPREAMGQKSPFFGDPERKALIPVWVGRTASYPSSPGFPNLGKP